MPASDRSTQWPERSMLFIYLCACSGLEPSVPLEHNALEHRFVHLLGCLRLLCTAHNGEDSPMMGMMIEGSGQAAFLTTKN
jgi:hypothetical protein